MTSQLRSLQAECYLFIQEITCEVRTLAAGEENGTANMSGTE